MRTKTHSLLLLVVSLSVVAVACGDEDAVAPAQGTGGERTDPNGVQVEPCTATDGWQIETVGEGGSVENPSLRVAANGGVHVAYTVNSKITAEDGLRYALKTPGSDWSVEALESGKYLLRAKLFLDSSAQPSIAFRYDNDDAHMLLGRREDGTWSSELLSAADGPFGGSTHFGIAIDEGAVVHAASLDRETANIYYAARPPSGEWDVEVLDDNPVGGRPILDVGPTGTAVVAYQGELNHGLKLAQRHEGGAWRIYPADSADDTGHGASVVVDAEAGAHVAYHRERQPGLAVSWGDLWYGYLSADGSWAASRVEGVSEASRTALAVDAAGTVRIAYRDIEPTLGAIGIASRGADGTWHVEQFGEGTRPKEPAIAIDSAGGVHVAYLIDPDGNIASNAVRYAYRCY